MDGWMDHSGNYHIVVKFSDELSTLLLHLHLQLSSHVDIGDMNRVKNANSFVVIDGFTLLSA